MSLYNAIFGVNSMAPVFLNMLGIDMNPSEYRFRDAYLNENGTQIIIYTRIGGGNRQYYKDVIQKLISNPYYIEDYDDDFDSTYAYFVFKVPDKYLELTKSLASGEKPKSVSEKFKNLIKMMGDEE